MKQRAKRPVRRGTKMRHGKGWRLIKNGKLFVGSLLNTFNLGNRRIAVFSVPKRGEEDWS